jgi:hypothetical protein
MKTEYSRVLKEGLIAGLIAYATVVLFFLVLNVVTGRPAFYTPALLGSALFYDLRDPANLVIGAPPIIAYNGLHILASVLIGTFVAFLVSVTERHPQLWYVIFMIFLAGFVYTVAAMGLLAGSIFPVISWPVIVIANLAAAFTAGIYLWKAHPRLRERIEEASG